MALGLIIYFDGGSRGNPGPAGAGVVIATEAGQRVHEAGYFLGRQTNNAAEYHGLIRALQRAERCGVQPLRICSDSELLVRQITGAYQVKNAQLALLFRQAQTLLLRSANWQIRHVRREQNRRADELANLAMDQQRDVIVFDVDSGTGNGSAAGHGIGPGVGHGIKPGTAAEVRTDHAQADANDVAADVKGGAAGGANGTAGGANGRAAGGAKGIAADTAGEHGAKVTPAALAARAVHVVLAADEKKGHCEAGTDLPAQMAVVTVLPQPLCVYAAHALVPTILAIQNTEPLEFAAVPTLTVRCTRPGCTAAFRVAPLLSGNGNPPHSPPKS